MSKQPEALALIYANRLDVDNEYLSRYGQQSMSDSAAELRRLHFINAELVEALTTCLVIVEHLAGDSAPTTIEEARAALKKAAGDQ
jgi:hypothetical protein